VPKMAPDQKEALEKICAPSRVKNTNPKSLLNEVLLTLFDDRPEYKNTVEKSEEGCVVFCAHVIGAQIGTKTIGRGHTVQEAEENAARAALNGLLSTPTFVIPHRLPCEKNFRKQLDELTNFFKLSLAAVSTTESAGGGSSIRFY